MISTPSYDMNIRVAQVRMAMATKRRPLKDKKLGHCTLYEC